MNLSELADRSGIDLRRLRYVVDHVLVKVGDDAAGTGRGWARVLTEEEAFGVATGALMLMAGLSREHLEGFWAGLERTLPGRRGILAWLGRPGHNAVEALEIADGQFIRAICPGAPEPSWRQLRTHRAAGRNYRPLVVCRIAIGELRRRLVQ